MIWHKITPFSRHCASVPCNVTRLVTWSLLSCCHPWWRDHFYPGTGAAEQKCCVRGWVTGWPFRPLVRPRLSQLVMASGNNYQCINILKVSLSKLMNSSNHTPWLSVAGAAEISSRVCWWWWWWQCWCWLLTSSSLPRTIRNTNLGHAHLSLHIDVVTFYFLFTLDCYNFPISHQPIGVKINISDQ